MSIKSNYYQGDPLGIHDPSEAELGGVGPDSDGRFAKRSRKLVRGFFLMVIIALSWVATLHLLRMSFHTERVLLAIQPIAGNYTFPLPNRARNSRQTLINETATMPSLSATHENIIRATTTKVSDHNYDKSCFVLKLQFILAT